MRLDGRIRRGGTAVAVAAVLAAAGCGDGGSGAEDDAQEIADQASAELDSTLDRGRTALTQLADTPDVKDHDVTGCTAAAKQAVESAEDYSVAGAAAPDGDLWCLTLPLTDPVNVTDRAYFQLAAGSGEFAVGDYQIGRVTADETIVTSYPLEMRGEERPGVVLISIELPDLAKLLARSTELPEGGELIVTDGHGTVLASAPDADLVGRNLSGTPLVADMLEDESGSGSYTLDGQELTWAFTRPDLAGHSLHVAAGVQD
jgi:hypothetical protein